MYAMSAAHRTLPLGTLLLVTNLENGNSVKVTVNDRGPFVKGRIIDLSYSAFKRLDRPEKGTTRVILEVLGRDTKYVRYIKFEEGGKGPYVVQLGSFANRRNAGRLKDALSWNYRDVYITKVKIYGKDFYRVRIGKFKKREKAHKLAKARSLKDKFFCLFNSRLSTGIFKPSEPGSRPPGGCHRVFYNPRRKPEFHRAIDKSR
jgi:rare lipoprotein A